MMFRRYFGLPDWNFRSQFDQFDRLRRQLDVAMDSLAGRTAGRRAGVFPLINLTEDSNNYYIRAELPGVKSEDLDIQATSTTISLAGERKIPAESNDARYHRRERESGKFSRMISLSTEIDPNKVEAGLANGIMTIKLPKSEKAKPKQITIK